MPPSPEPLFADHSLAARIEGAAVRHSLACARTLAETRTAIALPVAGGVATLMGRGGSLPQAVGLGLSGPVEERDIVAMEDLYRGTGLPVRTHVCPHADPSLFALLGARGHRLAGMENVLARRLGPEDAAPIQGEVATRIAGPDEAAAWVQLVDEGFREHGDAADPQLLGIFEALFRVPSSTYFLAVAGDTMIGGGGVDSQDGVAYLFGTSTLHRFRGRGAHAALLDARLAFARAQGCDLAVTVTDPGSTSQRNAERRGFRVVYTRTQTEKHL